MKKTFLTKHGSEMCFPFSAHLWNLEKENSNCKQKQNSSWVYLLNWWDIWYDLICIGCSWLDPKVNTASDAQSHLLNRKADMKSASGLISDLKINGWVQHKILMSGIWVLQPPLSPHRVRGIGDRRLNAGLLQFHSHWLGLRRDPTWVSPCPRLICLVSRWANLPLQCDPSELCQGWLTVC